MCGKEETQQGSLGSVGNTTEQSPVGSEAEASVEIETKQEKSKGCWVKKKCRSRCIVPRDAIGARMVAGLEREALRQGPGNV